MDRRMELSDFWDDLRFVFEGQSEQISEIDLINLKAGSMAECFLYLLTTAKDCTCRFLITGTETQVLLPSPQTAVNYVLQGQVTVSMWLSYPAIPMLSIYIDFTDSISFGYVRGTWNAMAVLAFFDLMYELKRRSPGSEIRPSMHTFTKDEQNLLMTFWQDYKHA